MRYSLASIFSTIFVLLLAHSTLAYELPSYRLSDLDQVTPAEEIFNRLAAVAAESEKVIPLSKMAEKARDPRLKFSKEEQKAYRRYREIEVPLQFFRYVVDLKKALLQLPHLKSSEAGAYEEADMLAKMIVDRIYELSPIYKVWGGAHTNNIAIALNLRDRGYCYHYTSDLLKVLLPKTWRFFDFHWAGAHKGTLSESNALAITAKGVAFETGLVVDAWRTGGKPYWHVIEGDRWPWKRIFPYAIEP